MTIDVNAIESRIVAVGAIMKIDFEIKGLKVNVDGDVPQVIVDLASEVAKSALAELEKIKARNAKEE